MTARRAAWAGPRSDLRGPAHDSVQHFFGVRSTALARSNWPLEELVPDEVSVLLVAAAEEAQAAGSSGWGRPPEGR